MPIAPDTAGVVGELKLNFFTFSGGVLLSFAKAPEVFLTWTKHTPYLLEATTEVVAWTPFSLNRVRASPEPPWDQVEGQPLAKVELFSSPELNGGVVGLRHIFGGRLAGTRMWIGTGSGDGIQEGDDLWIGVDIDPPNYADLTLVQTIGRHGRTSASRRMLRGARRRGADSGGQ